MSNPFAGTWTYRSFLNDPAPVGSEPAKLEYLLFAAGMLTVQDTAPTVFRRERQRMSKGHHAAPSATYCRLVDRQDGAKVGGAFP